MVGAAMRTPLPPRTLSPPVWPYSPAPPPRTSRERSFSSHEGDGGRPEHQSFAVRALEPDVELHGMRLLLLLRDGSAQPHAASGKDEATERRAETAERADAGPRLDRDREQSHAHVSRRDHPRKAFGARAVVIGEARGPLVRCARVGPDLVLGEIELMHRQLVPFLDVRKVSRHRCMKRLSTTATISPR